jgi:DNA-binding NarL/FixJ family response regulator
MLCHFWVVQLKTGTCRGPRRGARGVRGGDPRSARAMGLSRTEVLANRRQRREGFLASTAKSQQAICGPGRAKSLKAEIHDVLRQSFTGTSMQLGVAGEQAKASDCVTSAKDLANRRKIRYHGDAGHGTTTSPHRANSIMKPSSTSATKLIRVLIADDHPVVREGLGMILKSEKDIEVVAEAADGKETCELYQELAPDVLLLDLRMPEKDGLQVITELMSRGEPKPRIIVMTTYESEGDVRRVLKAGAKGYLVKGADPQQIREAVRKVAAGQSLLQPEIASKLAESMARPELSERELEVLQSMALGRSNKEIGQALYISENTVKGHVKSILTKLDAIGRTEAIAIANRRGLIQTG